MRIAFIVGCARSGTSILAELIAAHRKVNYLGEENQHFWHSLLGEREHHEAYAEDATPERIEAARDYFASLDDGRILLDKCPPNSLRCAFLRRVFREAVFIHIIRDGRDVACSLQPGIGGDQWLHLKPQGWQRVMTSQDGLARAAWLWRTVVRRVKVDLLGTDYMQVWYEDLAQVPGITAAGCCRRLDLPPSAEVVGFCNKVQNETRGSYQAQGQDVYYQNDHSVRVGRYRENLKPAEIERLELLLAPELESAGYLERPVRPVHFGRRP